MIETAKYGESQLSTMSDICPKYTQSDYMSSDILPAPTIYELWISPQPRLFKIKQISHASADGRL